LREQFNFVLDSMEFPEKKRERALVRYENMMKIIKEEPVDKEAEEKLKPQIEPQLKWLQSFVKHDPLSVLDRIDAAVLIINGGKDKQVFPEHAKMLHRRLKKLKKMTTLKIFPDLNHLLVPAETGAYAEYARISMEERRVSEKLLDYLSGWLYGVLNPEK
ncbi:MAG: prolyl oligopeptidase family serine peptidase, partial [Candidatus Aminicenantes bacterium]